MFYSHVNHRPLAASRSMACRRLALARRTATVRLRGNHSGSRASAAASGSRAASSAQPAAGPALRRPWPRSSTARWQSARRV